MKFKHTNRKYFEYVDNWAILWTLIFGFFYFMYRGMFLYSALALGIAFLTGGISWFVVPFLAPSLMKEYYFNQGWIECD